MDFDAFWALYPRKAGKADARRAWARLKPEQRAAAMAALPRHIAYWQACGTENVYIKYPQGWLNGERWEDELEMPTFERTADWWRTDKGVQEKANELGMSARPGEEMAQFRERVIAAAKSNIRRVA